MPGAAVRGGASARNATSSSSSTRARSRFSSRRLLRAKPSPTKGRANQPSTIMRTKKPAMNSTALPGAATACAIASCTHTLPQAGGRGSSSPCNVGEAGVDLV